jgi:hypothetical protein
MFFVGVQLLQKYGYVSSVNWDKLGNDTSTQNKHWAANVDVSNDRSGIRQRNDRPSPLHLQQPCTAKGMVLPSIMYPGLLL